MPFTGRLQLLYKPSAETPELKLGVVEWATHTGAEAQLGEWGDPQHY